MTKVVLYSGGLDSFCLAHAVQPDLLVYFDIGLPEQQYEQAAIQAMHNVGALPAPIVFDTRFHLAPYKLENEVMPFRNLFFLAGGFTYGDKLYLGKTASSRNLDKNSTFAAKALDVLKYVSQNPAGNPPGLLAENMEILLPFDTKTKSQFLSEFISNGGNLEHLRMSRSCYKPHGKECGKCQSCIRKSIAFVNNNLAIDFFESTPIPYYQAQLDHAIKVDNILVTHEVRNALHLVGDY
jgi:7-cyano-7-deazaguanine synthase